MKTIKEIVVVSGFLLLATANAKERVIEGWITGYECGDNCYLTIIDSNKKEYTALCAAPLCQRWNEETQMPARFKRQKVKVTIGRGVQYDGGGHLMGQMDAFKKIEFLK